MVALDPPTDPACQAEYSGFAATFCLKHAPAKAGMNLMFHAEKLTFLPREASPTRLTYGDITLTSPCGPCHCCGIRLKYFVERRNYDAQELG
jgi:hypothetical protein